MSSITWTRSTLFSPHISLFLLPFSPSFLYFVHRHLDSSSNERPDISSLQKRIKVYFLEDRKEVHCVVRILSVMSHYCEEKVILMYFQVFLILNWREKCMKVLRSFCILIFSESDPWHGHVLWDDGKSVPQRFSPDSLCVSSDALCWPVRCVLHQSTVLPFQLHVQSRPRPGKLNKYTTVDSLVITIRKPSVTCFCLWFTFRCLTSPPWSTLMWTSMTQSRPWPHATATPSTVNARDTSWPAQ